MRLDVALPYGLVLVDVEVGVALDETGKEDVAGNAGGGVRQRVYELDVGEGEGEFGALNARLAFSS